jgi:hypothetical protein
MHCCTYDAPGMSIKSVDIAAMLAELYDAKGRHVL